MPAAGDPPPLYRIQPKELPNFCSLGLVPHLMTGFLVQVLRQHFADRDNIADPPLRHTLWEAQNPRGIVIESATRWDPQLAQKRPAVLVRRNSWSVAQIALNNEYQGWLQPDGSRHFEDLWRGSHTLFCLARESEEAERLGTEVALEVFRFGPILSEYLRLAKFVPMQLDQLHKIDDAVGGWAVPVSFAYAATQTWTIRREAAVLNEISLKTLLSP
jgi:hypothetical protein